MGSALLRRVILRFGSRIGAHRLYFTEPMLMTPPFFDEEGRMENKFHSIVKPVPDAILDTQGIAAAAAAAGGFKKQSSGVAAGDIKHVEVVGMSFSWLALYNRVSHALHILNPITGRRIDLPPLPGVSRAILSDPPDDENRRSPVVVAAVHGGGRRLAVCEAGISGEWRALADGGEIEDEREYEDIIFPDREPYLHCLTRNPTHLIVWDVDNRSDPRPWRVARWPQLDDQQFCWPSSSREALELKRRCWRTKYIVLDSECHSAEKFYMVVRHILPPTLDRPYKTFDFDVYSYEERVALRYMKCSLNDQVMFIGTNQSCSMKGLSFGLDENSIYFTDDWRNMRRPALGGHGHGHDNGVFDYRNYTLTTCCSSSCPLDNTDKLEEEKEKKIIRRAPLWFMYYMYDESMRQF